jgi:arginyl-tRNA synthetase
VGHDLGRHRSGAPPFGQARRIYNVIDSRQMYLQALLSQALRTLGHPDEAERLDHFSYEMVALSHATAQELGYETAPKAGGPSDARANPSSRCRAGRARRQDRRPARLLIGKAAAEVAKRNPKFTPTSGPARRADRRGGIRYFMLKFSRGKLIVFDIEEALSFEGETGPYLQYAVVRANNIFSSCRNARDTRPPTSSP